MSRTAARRSSAGAAIKCQEIIDMADIVFIFVAIAFFALCVAYVRGLDRLVRASEEGEAAQETPL